ncbi:MAG TPA: hypothetical protein VGR06_40320 [Actinophytocola sp.]|uniref:hypothetical protein n=1 Tax=Actinophytocola sp. TaxID=1872138 RepID=UPI002DFB3E21|nr:hypothetical protein [Actinophytocola sp.]
MSALVLDAGAFVAVDRGDRAMIARLRAAQRHAVDLRTNAMVVSQVWRDPYGRQAQLAILLRAVDVQPVDQQIGRDAGVLLGRAGMRDSIDATVVLMANTGDRVITSDPQDIAALAHAADRKVLVVSC